MNEESTWDWKNQKEAIQGESLSVAPMITPMTSQVHDEDEEPSQPRMRSLQDLYDSTDEVHLVCLLADSENTAFKEAVRDKMIGMKDRKSFEFKGGIC